MRYIKVIKITHNSDLIPENHKLGSQNNKILPISCKLAVLKYSVKIMTTWNNKMHRNNEILSHSNNILETY